MERAEVLEKFYHELIEDYAFNSDVCMAEYLASTTTPPDITFEEAFLVYVRAMKEANGDGFFTIKEGEKIEL